LDAEASGTDGPGSADDEAGRAPGWPVRGLETLDDSLFDPSGAYGEIDAGGGGDIIPAPPPAPIPTPLLVPGVESSILLRRMAPSDVSNGCADPPPLFFRLIDLGDRPDAAADSDEERPVSLPPSDDGAEIPPDGADFFMNRLIDGELMVRGFDSESSGPEGGAASFPAAEADRLVSLICGFFGTNRDDLARSILASFVLLSVFRPAFSLVLLCSICGRHAPLI